MGAYKYECPHEDCAKLDEGIRKCKSCGMVIITNRGIETDFEKWMKENGYVWADGRRVIWGKSIMESILKKDKEKEKE